MGQHLHEATPYFEPPVELIPMEPRDAPPEILPEVEAGVEEAHVYDEPQAEDDRAHRIAVYPSMDVDVVVESIVGSPLIAAEDEASRACSHRTTSAARWSRNFRSGHAHVAREAIRFPSQF